MTTQSDDIVKAFEYALAQSDSKDRREQVRKVVRRLREDDRRARLALARNEQSLIGQALADPVQPRVGDFGLLERTSALINLLRCDSFFDEAGLVEELEQMRTELLEPMTARELLDEAFRLSTAPRSDLHLTLRLLDLIEFRGDAVERADVIDLREYVGQLLRDHLRLELPAAQPGESWQTALATLERVREDLKSNPDWRATYIRTCLQAVDQLLDTAYDELLAPNFERARIDFDEAGACLRRAIERAPYPAKLLPLGGLQAEADDLARTAQALHVAQQRWMLGDHERAVAALNQAGTLRRQERAAGRGFPLALALTSHWQREYNGWLDRIQTDTAALERAFQAFANHRLGEAEELLDQLHFSPLTSLHARVRTLEEEILQAKLRAQGVARRAGEAGDVWEALEHARRAYECWLDSDELRAGFVTALVAAGDLAVRDPNSIDAGLQHFALALELDPANEAARNGLQHPEHAQAVRARLAVVRSELERLLQDERAEAAAVDHLRAQVVELCDTLPAYADLRALIDDALARLEEVRTKLAGYEDLLKQARQMIQRGNWRQGLAKLRLAHEFRAPLPPWAAAQAQQWERAAQAIADLSASIGERWKELEARYTNLSPTLKLDVELLREILTGLEQDLRRVEEQARAVGGKLPHILREYKRDGEQRWRVVEVVAAALAQPPEESLTTLRASVAELGDDRLLAAAIEVMLKQLAARRPQLEDEVREAERQGKLGDAITRLGELRKLADEPRRQGYDDWYERLVARQKFEGELVAVYSAAAAVSDSLTARRDMLAKGLILLCDVPTALIDAEVQGAAHTLVAIFEHGSYTSFGEPDTWRTALEQQSIVKRRAHWHWSGLAAQQLIEQWLPLARESALVGLVGTNAAIGNVVAAYKAAWQLYDITRNTETLDTLTAQLKALKAHVFQETDKQLARARKGLETGEFEVTLLACAVLEQLYQSLGEVSALDDILSGRKDDDPRRDITLLREQGQTLKGIAKRARPLLQEAQQKLYVGELQEVDARLRELPPGLDARLPALHTRAVELRQQLGEARRLEIDRMLSKAISIAQVALITAATPDKVEAAQQTLKDVLVSVGTEPIAKETLELFSIVNGQLANRQEQLLLGPQWLQSARDLRDAGKFADADRAYSVALDKYLVDPDLRAQARKERIEISSKVERERKVQQGRVLFEQGLYSQALPELVTSDPASDELLRAAARAGSALERAQKSFQRRLGLEQALVDVEFALDLVQGNPLAREIERSARKLRDQLTGALESLNAALATARQAIGENRLAEARRNLQRARTIDAEHFQIEPVEFELERLQGAQQLADLAKRTRTQLDEAQLDEAELLIAQMLKLDPSFAPALALRDQLDAERELIGLIRVARQFANQNRFRDARARLLEAESRGARVSQINAARSLIEDNERRYREDTISPLRDLIRQQQYREVVQQINTLRDRAAAGDYVDQDVLDDLPELLRLATRRWLAQTRPALVEATAQLAAALATLADPTVFRREELQGLEAAELRLTQLEEELLGMAEDLRLDPQNLTAQEIETMRRQTAAARHSSQLWAVECTLQIFDGLRASEYGALAGIPQSLAEAHALTLQVQRGAGFEALAQRAGELAAEISVRLSLQDCDKALAAEDLTAATAAIASAPGRHSHLLNTAVKQRRALVEELLQAHQYHEDGEEDLAISIYSRHREHPALQWVAKRYQECQEQLTTPIEAAVMEILAALEEEPVIGLARTRGALRQLKEAHEQGWLTPSAVQRFPGWERRLSFYERLYAALEELIDGRPEVAIALLGEARGVTRARELLNLAKEWEYAAGASLALRREDSEAAARSLAQITALEHPFVDQLHAEMRRLREANR